jgi:hypothetical protein
VLQNANKKGITVPGGMNALQYLQLNRSSKGRSSPMPLLVSSPRQKLDPPMKCVICGHPILWKQARVTDDGKLVHEECLAAKLVDEDTSHQTNC